MRKPDGNIFVADNSPWHSISGNLPASDGYPEESDLYESDLYGVGLPPLDSPGATVRDSCLCGDITFQITEPFKVAHNCHCSRCRYGRATAHASNGFVSSDGLQYLTGEDRLRSYKVPEAKFFTQVFCATCSSLMPRRDIDRGICVVPLGSLDDDAGVKPVDHIFIGNKASWHDITDGLPQFQEGPL
ncbi:MAG: aldehyde-activating protein [Gammaproteobacteria bacterium]|nr:aldehyde-activating protein [Gammaproteobacteria bacterium]